MNIVCQNRKAYHDYHIEEKVEAGIALLGTEVKSLREGKGNLKDSYVLAKDSGSFLLIVTSALTATATSQIMNR